MNLTQCRSARQDEPASAIKSPPTVMLRVGDGRCQRGATCWQFDFNSGDGRCNKKSPSGRGSRTGRTANFFAASSDTTNRNDRQCETRTLNIEPFGTVAYRLQRNRDG